MTRILLACCAALALSACGDPLAGIERVSDGTVDLSETGSIRAVQETEDMQSANSVFAGLFARRAPVPKDAVPAETEVAEGDVATASTRSTGLLGGLFTTNARDFAAQAQSASLDPDTSTARSRSGLFGTRSGPPRNAPDTQLVAAGTRLPFGEVARVCDISASDMGEVAERFGKGGGRFTLRDTDPGSTAPRSFYVTGFADGCARKFTAALAMFGDPAMHEQLRYGLPSEKYPYSTTDKAYERVKSAVCGVPRRKPCGAQIKTLSRNTVFISTYERFTDNGRWSDILLHDGWVLAAAIKEL